MNAIRECLNRCRDEIKGAAILWVVFFHAQLGLGGFLHEVQEIGYGGVDLFFFLSGYGLFLSLEKDADLERYLKRRAWRLLPAYLPVCAAWLCVMLPLLGAGTATSVRIAAGNLTMTGLFANLPMNLNWYVSALLGTLLAAPILHAMMKTDRGAWLALGLSFAIGLGFIGQEQYMAVSRLPVFVLGMLLARPWRREPGAKAMAALLATGTVVGLAILEVCLKRFEALLIDYAMFWYPFALIAPALCAGLGWLFARSPKAVCRPFAFLGRASFEIFLLNAWIELAGKRFGLCQTPAQWAAWSLGSIALGLGYHALVTTLTCRMKKLKKRD